MKKKETEKAQSPSFSKRVGSIRVSVFDNAAESGRVYSNIALVRRYRGNDGEWHDSNVLSGTVDALCAIQGLQRAIDFIDARENGGSDGEE